MNESMKIVRCKMGDNILGPMKVADLRMIPGFTLSCLVSPEATDDWTPAFKTIDLSAYFGQNAQTSKEPLDSDLLTAVEFIGSENRPQTTVATMDPAYTLKPPAVQTV